MARNNLNLNASLRLKTGEFKKGVRDIQGSLKSLQRSFLGVAGALGAGLGLTQLLSNLKNTAVQLSVAQATLQNVSQVTKTFTDGTNKMDVAISNYGENLKYVQDLAKKYGQDQIALTQNFAQFTAACKGTNIALEEQRDIFDALTQAATYYHMSTSQVDDMQRAIVQMASKGKVASEELRRQLGNSLPGAFNLMAASLGVSNAELEKMMKNGEVLAEDALPKFAAMLKTVTSNYNLDSIQISLNRLKNAWTDMVQSSGFERGMNWMVKKATSVVSWFSDYFWPKVIGIGVGIGSGIGLPNLFGQNLQKEMYKMEREYKEAEHNLKSMQKKLGRVSYFQRDPESNLITPNAAKVYENFNKAKNAGGEEWTKYRKETAQNFANLREYNRELVKTEDLRKKIYKGGTPLISEEDLKILRRINEAGIKEAKNIKGINEELEEVPQTINKGTAASRAFAGVWKTVGTLIKTALSSIAIGAIIAAITTLIGKWIELGQRMKEARNIYNQYEADVKASNESVLENAAVLRSNLRVLQDISKSDAARIAALKKINELTGSKYTADLIKQKDAINKSNEALGKTKDAYKDIVDSVEKWIEATKIQAKVQVQANKQATAESEIERLQAENKEIQEKIYNPKSFWEQFQRNSLRKRFQINQTAIEQYKRVVQSTEAALDELGVSLVEVQSQMNDIDKNDDSGGKAKGIEKVFKDWKEEKEKLVNQLKEGAITQKEYDEEFDKLVLKTWGEAAGSGKLSLKDILGKKGKLSEMEQWYVMLAEQAREVAVRTIERDMDDLADEIDKELDAAFAEELKKLKENQEKVAEELGKIKLPKFEAPETWDNYKMTDAEIWERSASSVQDYVDSLKDIRDTMQELKNEYGDLGLKGELAFEEIQKTIDKLGDSAKTLRDKARVEEWKNDIKELKEELASDIYSSVKNVAEAFERLDSSMRVLFEMDEIDEDLKQTFDKISAFINILETTLSIIEGIKTAIEVGTALSKAQASVEMQNMEKELAMKGAIAAADTAGAATAVEAGAVKIATAHATANALKSVATAGAAANAMELPFPYNLAALATNMAALTAALSAGKALEAFAGGGIVGGNSMSGDHNLIRANSGEMILNKTQQSQLWDFIKNGSQGFGGGKVEFEIRGDKLQGVLSNYERKRRG